MTSTDKERTQGGTPESARTEESRSAAKTSVRKDYSDSARVYIINSRKTIRGIFPKPELGKTERQVINSGAKLAKTILADDHAKPMEVVITPDSKKTYFGKFLSIEKDFSDEDAFARELAEVVSEGVIKYVAVLVSDDFFKQANVFYGRDDHPEFMATVWL